MLTLQSHKYYQIKEGQTLEDVAKTFCVAVRVLVRENGLKYPPCVGQILKIPCLNGNVYTAKTGETQKLLCGNEENYRLKNGTDVLYPGMRVIL